MRCVSGIFSRNFGTSTGSNTSMCSFLLGLDMIQMHPITSAPTINTERDVAICVPPYFRVMVATTNYVN